jgi:sugar lactone lactonase YvrE
VIGGVVGVVAGVTAVAVALGGGDETPPADVATATTSDAVTTTAASSATTAGTAAATSSSGPRAIDTFAGNGQSGTGGEGGPAVDAGMDRPESVAVSSTGDVYIADNISQRILKVSKGILTVLHRVAPGETSNTFGVAVAPDDSVWFSNQRGVFKMDGTTAKLVLEEQVSGAPYALAFDKAGNLFIAELGGCRVLKYDTSGRVTVIAGTGEPSPQQGGVGDGGPATAALLGRPVQIAVDRSGNLYIAENFSERIRKVTPDGTISTVAGGGTIDIAAAKDGTPAKDINFDTVDGVAVDEQGDVYASDHQQGDIIRFHPDGTGLERVATSANSMLSPFGMAFGSDGALYFIDSSVVRRIAGVG